MAAVEEEKEAEPVARMEVKEIGGDAPKSKTQTEQTMVQRIDFSKILGASSSFEEPQGYHYAIMYAKDLVDTI